MCSDVALSVKQLAKHYHIYDKPLDRLKQSLWRGKKQYFTVYKALDNVSFELNRGSTLGIIGRNGAGKSTLLQLICGTLTPSAGNVEVNGRIAALLELGSGFNSEFTGRENVFMSAALLGLSKSEIEARFADIEEFAGIGSFIDQPVKTYSSGMYVRLAFAVLAHVDADILIIDEALAVGDAVFVQKCMRFIRDFQERGTLLFVSHDMGSVINLCEKALWIEKGEIKMLGVSKKVAEAYLQSTLQEVYGDKALLQSESVSQAGSEEEESHREEEEPLIDYESEFRIVENLASSSGWQTGDAEIVEVNLHKHDGEGIAGVFRGGERVCLTINAVAHRALKQPILGFIVKDKLGQDLFGENTLHVTQANPIQVDDGGHFEARFCFRLPMLPNGQYAVMASVADGNLVNNVQHHYLHDAMILNVSSSKVRWGLVGVPFDQVEIGLSEK